MDTDTLQTEEPPVVTPRAATKRLQPGQVAINLGSGSTFAPGWINVDNSPGARLSRYPRLRWLLWHLRILSPQRFLVVWPEKIVIHDLRKPLPFPDNHADFIFSSHALEHLSYADGQRVMAEARRVLKPGGVAHIVVPDMYVHAKRYLELYDKDPRVSESLNRVMQRFADGREPHRWMYDEHSLGRSLGEAGFGDVTRVAPYMGQVPDLHILDYRWRDSLIMEGVKP